MPAVKRGDVVKLREGTYRKDRAVPEQNADASEPPQCPDWLPDDARQHWDALVADLIDLGVQLHPVDQDPLATYCVIFTRFIQAPQEVNAATLGQMRQIWEKYGMTNGARSALGLHPKKKKKNKFAHD